MDVLWQTIGIAVAVIGAVAYLAWHYLSGRKRKGSCPNCQLHNLPKNVTRHRPPNRHTAH